MLSLRDLKMLDIAPEHLFTPRNKIIYKDKLGTPLELHVADAAQWLESGYLVCSMNLERDILPLENYAKD
ncbi:MAG: hypothetical protein ACK559_37030, partial [bacterium]